MQSLVPQFLSLDASTDLGAALPSSYNWMLVTFSVVIASLAAYAALGGAARLKAAETSFDKRAWLVTGAVTMGIGVWAMHFIGMLAFTLPVAVGYDILITAVSMIPAILASWVVLQLVNRDQIGIWRLIVGGVLMGSGIGIMHYTGMAAMRMDALMFYDPVMFIVSVLVAVVLSIIALYTKFRATSHTQSLVHWTTLGAAVVMGLAVSGMHYTGMAAARFYPGSGSYEAGGLALDPVWLGAWLGLATAFIIGLAIFVISVLKQIGIRGRLLLAFFFISAFAVLAGTTALYSFLEVGKALRGIAQTKAPEAITSLEVSRQAERMVRGAQTMLTTTNAGQREQIHSQISAEGARLDKLLIRLKEVVEDDELLGTIEYSVGQLRGNLDELNGLMAHRLQFIHSREKSIKAFREAYARIQEVFAATTRDYELERVLDSAVDGSNAEASSLIGLRPSAIAAQAANKHLLTLYGVFLDTQLITRAKQLPELSARAQMALGSFKSVMSKFDASLRDALKTDIDKLHEFTEGPGSIFARLQDEFSAQDKARDVLIENAWVSEELSNTVEQLVSYSKKDMTDAISGATSAQQTSIWMIMFIVVISLVCSTLIVWRYVGRNLIRRLTEISDSMESVAGGDLRVHLPDSQSNDEIDRMTKALTVFRDTAIEIEEDGLREIGQARQRLVDAIESTHEGFVLYDADDRIVLANQRFLDMYSGLEDLIVPGTRFETLIRAVVDRGLTGSTDEDPESWIQGRLSFHRDPQGEHVYQLNDGRWVQVNERKTEAGGTVSVFADITELKESEQRTADANRLLNQSLRYASRIQAAILPARRELASVTSEHFLIWEPRDIVGGDFFWFQRIPNGYAVIVGDCTGHGVPGAFMTLVAWGLLDGMLQSAAIDKPSQVLSELHRGVQTLLGQDQPEGDTDDGLDVGVCFVNKAGDQMVYAGAKFSLWHAENGSINEIKGDRAGIGYRRYPADATFSDVILRINKGAKFYMTTDGLIDQVGGPRGRSFGKRRLLDFIKQNQELPMENQAEKLSRTVAEYQGDQLRRDDLTVMGFVPNGT